jgi:Amt family ammonium transporter
MFICYALVAHLVWGSGFLVDDGIFATIMVAVFGYANFTTQLGSFAIVAAWSAGVSVALIDLIKAIVPLRVSVEEEENGLDLLSHSERPYNFMS